MARFVDDEDPDDDVVTGEGVQQDQAEDAAPGAARVDDDEGDKSKAPRRGSGRTRFGVLMRMLERQQRDIEELRRDKELDLQARKQGEVGRTIDEAASTISSRMAAARNALKTALADGDADKAADLQIEIGQLSVRHARLQDHQHDLKARQQAQAAPDPGGSAPQLAPHLAEWKAENSDWFVTPQDVQAGRANAEQAEMSQFALMAEEYVAQNLKLRPGSPESLEKVQEAMENKFPDYFFGRQLRGLKPPPAERGSVEVDTAPPARREPPAGASRFAPPTSGGTGAPHNSTKVRLSAEDLKWASKLKMTPEQYAEGLRAAKADGDL